MDVIYVAELLNGMLFKRPYSKYNSTYMDNNTNKDTISKLKFISRLNKGEKVNVRYMYVQPAGLATCISRTFFNIDNRKNTQTFIQATIRRSFDIISLYIRSDKLSEQQLALNLLDDLEKAKNGLFNLKETYIDDTMFGCQMDTLFEELDAKIIEFNDQINTMTNVTRDESNKRVIVSPSVVSKQNMNVNGIPEMDLQLN